MSCRHGTPLTTTASRPSLRLLREGNKGDVQLAYNADDNNEKFHSIAS
jgi:hypothetical protein